MVGGPNEPEKLGHPLWTFPYSDVPIESTIRLAFRAVKNPDVQYIFWDFRNSDLRAIIFPHVLFSSSLLEP